MDNVIKRLRDELPTISCFGRASLDAQLELKISDIEDWGIRITGMSYYSDNQWFDDIQFRADFEGEIRNSFPECEPTFYWKTGELELKYKKEAPATTS
jgi:hypothetical protein